MKLCLGTVQFGMDYGVCGQKQPLTQDSIAMLDYAVQNGIDTIDTANAYGQAENIVGAWLKANPPIREKINLISKFRPDLLNDVNPEKYYSIMKANLEQSLSRLHTDYLDGYLLHNAHYVFSDEIIEALTCLKKQGYIKNIGVSVYETNEAVRGIERDNLDFIQLPYSIFDRRMLHDGIFDLALEKNFVLHSRSAFVQGLILMDENDIPFYLSAAKPFVSKFSRLCEEYGISRIALALGFVKRQNAISHLVFGVDNLKQLKEYIEEFDKLADFKIIDLIAKEFTNIPDEIALPGLWKRN